MNRSNGLLAALARAAFPAALAFILAACGSSSPLSGTAGSGAPASGEVAAEWKDGRLAIDVPVPVITFGFAQEEVVALATELAPHTVNHESGDINQVIPPDVNEGLEEGVLALVPLFGESITLPVLPTAKYAVQAAPAALENELRAALDAARLEGELFDANAVEDFLAAALPRHGFPINPNAASMVVLHLERYGIGSHGWKIQGPTGFVAPVRLFGERHPLVVLDPSAIEDPYAGSGGYFSPVPSGDAANIAAYVHAATEYRVLQGSIYPIPQAACHAVTAIMGVRTVTSFGENFLRPVADALDPERIKTSFDHLTGTDVFFDLKVLSLPADDPVLDLIARAEFPAFEILRGYLTLQWESYHVDHPGCEEYLTVVFEGDVAAVPGGGVLGIGTWDDSPGKRIAMGWVHELFRLIFDPESPLCQIDCDSKEYLNWWEYLISHETGHLFGMRHPHDISRPGGVSESNNAFSSVWSSMSYQQDGRMIDFGAIDHANWLRNRAGYALALASLQEREGSAEWNAAMAAARRLDWQGVWEILNTSM